jgi:voltage-gated sodium channel
LLIIACRALVESKRFQDFVIGVIVFTAVLMGLETFPSVQAAYGLILHRLNLVIQAIFVCELAIRLLAHGPRWGTFFRDGWNVFDFTIVAASLLPQVGAFATVARLARLLRVARLLSVSPALRLIITTMLHSIPSLGHVILLLSLLLYVYGIIGYHLFHPHDPAHWGTLGRALLTLFQMLTLEGWLEVQQASLQAYPWAWIYYGSYIVIAVFVVINLFIAVVLNNMETARLEQELAENKRHPRHVLLARLRAVSEELAQLERLVRAEQTKEEVGRQ